MIHAKNLYSNILSLMFLVGMLIPISANPSNVKLTRNHLQQLHKVRKLLRGKKYKKSLNLLNRLLNSKITPALHAHFRILKGVSLEKLGRIDIAKDTYQKVIGKSSISNEISRKISDRVYRSDQSKKSISSLDDIIPIIDVGILIVRVNVNRHISLERLKPETVELIGVNSDQTYTPDAMLKNSYVFLRVPFGHYTCRTKSPCLISSRLHPYNKSTNRIKVSNNQTYKKVSFNIAEAAVISPCGKPSVKPNDDDFTIPDLKLSLPINKNGEFVQKYLPVHIALIDNPVPNFDVYRWKYTFDPDDPQADNHLNERGELNVPAFKDSGYTQWKSHMGKHPTYDVKFGENAYRNKRHMKIHLYRKKKETSD